MFLDCLKPNIPPRNESTPQYYTCCGRIHVKTILQVLIIISFAQHICHWVAYVAHRNSTGWIQITAGIFNVLVTASLVIAYTYKSAQYLLPYLIMQFFSLVFLFALFCASLLIVIWPSNPWSSSLYIYSSGRSLDIRLYALIFVIVSIISALLQIWLICVLLACYAYFKDIKETSSACIPSNVIVIEQPSGLNSKGTKDWSSELKNGEATMMPYAPVASPNPDSTRIHEDERNEDNFWPQQPSISTSRPD